MFSALPKDQRCVTNMSQEIGETLIRESESTGANASRTSTRCIFRPTLFHSARHRMSAAGLSRIEPLVHMPNPALLPLYTTAIRRRGSFVNALECMYRHLPPTTRCPLLAFTTSGYVLVSHFDCQRGHEEMCQVMH